MQLTTLIGEAKKFARGNPRKYALGASMALNAFGYRPRQQWGVTRGIKIDNPTIAEPESRTTLLSFVTSCLGKEGAAAKAASKPQGEQLVLSLKVS